MIDKRLIKAVPGTMPHILKNVALQVASLFGSILLMFSISFFIKDLMEKQIDLQSGLVYAGIFAVSVCMRVSFSYLASGQGYLASKPVKRVLRGKIYDKVVSMGGGYNKNISTAGLLQMSVEGVEQLETYFGSYLPQFFYSMIAPLILFFVVAFVDVKIAFILFICVPLIPVSIIAIQKIAKKLLAKYWGEYMGLADNFLENLQGLNTLKIYSSDEFKHKQMNKQAERFRVITMKVLSMQLNSIIVMDVVAYGGAALGIIVSLLELASGNIGVVGAFAVIMLAADFFLPLRLLGSFFHIAMNGVAQSKKIFELLGQQSGAKRTKTAEIADIKLRSAGYSYDEKKQVLRDVNMDIPKNSFVSVVGKSGSGKSTISAILTGANENYSGSITIGGVELSEISRESLLENITLVCANSYIFKGTVKENLLMANESASDEELWAVLKKVNLAEFLRSEEGLNTALSEMGANFSGGQCQRLAIARALLHKSDMYIFDEATSNIDADSEDEIMRVIVELARRKTVVVISHRLLNVVNSDMIYLLKEGELTERGTHDELLLKNGYYAELWNTQAILENAGVAS